MMISDPISPLALRTGEQYRRAAQLTTVMASRASVMLVSGTSGAETTRDIAAHLLKQSGRRAVCGLPEAAQAASQLKAGDFVVTDWVPTDGLRFEGYPTFVGLTACRADELSPDWSRQAYAGELARLVDLASRGVVANAADPVALGLAATARVPVHATGAIDPNPLAVRRGAQIVIREPDTGVRGVIPVADVPVAEEVLDACLVGITLALLSGVRLDAAADAVRSFRARSRGLQVAGDRRGVRWLVHHDARTPGASAQVAASIDRPLILISGGRAGGQPLDRWARAVSRARFVLLFGPAGDRFASALATGPTVVRCADVEDAVAAASRLARRGDAVLFSAGCDPLSGRFGLPEDRYLECLGLGAELRGEAA